jgi:hypothetical protein
VHADVASYSWLSLRGHAATESGVVTTSSGQSQQLTVGITPELFLRLYF